MKHVYMVSGILVALFGFAIFQSAETIMHKIFSGAVFTVSAILMTGAGIIESVERAQNRIVSALAQQVPDSGNSGDGD